MCVYIHMCSFVRACMHVKAEGQVFIKTRSLADLKPASLARLALLSQRWGYMYAPLCLIFFTQALGVRIQVLMPCTATTLRQSHSPSPSFPSLDELNSPSKKSVLE